MNVARSKRKNLQTEKKKDTQIFKVRAEKEEEEEEEEEEEKKRRRSKDKLDFLPAVQLESAT